MCTAFAETLVLKFEDCCWLLAGPELARSNSHDITEKLMQGKLAWLFIAHVTWIC
jgi:hypothetical protein